MSEQFPNRDKTSGMSWIKNPQKMFNQHNNQPSTSSGQSDNCSERKENQKKQDNKNETEEVVPKTDKQDVTNKNGKQEEEPISKCSDSDLMCLNIFEKLVSQWKLGDEQFVRLIDNFCNIYNSKDEKRLKLKKDLIETLTENVAVADVEELRELKKKLKETFLDESLKKFVVNDEDIILEHDDDVSEDLNLLSKKSDLFMGKLLKNGILTSVTIKKRQLLRNEANIVWKLNHPGIPKLLAINRDISKIVYEQYYHYVSIYRWELNQGFTTHMRPNKFIGILIKIAETMVYLHSKQILHTNLTWNCILISSDGNVIISNFDSAAYVGDSNGEYNCDKVLEECQLVFNVSPETIESKIFTTKSDVWAMGMLCFSLFDLLSGNIPFMEILTLEPIMKEVRQGVRKLRRPKKCPPILFSYMSKKLLNIDPAQRPNFSEIVTALEEIQRRV